MVRLLAICLLAVPVLAAPAPFTHKGQSTVRQVRSAERITTTLDNVTYDTATISHGGKLSFDVVVRRRHLITRQSDAEGQQSRLTLDVFLPGENPLSFTRDADALVLDDPAYFKSVKYGCCGAETRYELTSWAGVTFLKFHSRFLELEVPNAHEPWFVGYESDPDEQTLVLGRLSLAGLSGVVQTVVVKAASAEAFRESGGWSPEVRVEASQAKDQVVEDPHHAVFRLWSHDGQRGCEHLDGFALRLVFAWGEGSVERVLPFEKGLILGKKDAEVVLTLARP